MDDVTAIANKVLFTIGEPFLSVTEIEKLPSNTEKMDEIYKSLTEILQNRKVPQDVLTRLQAKALLDGIVLSDTEIKKHYGSNILLGFGVDL